MILKDPESGQENAFVNLARLNYANRMPDTGSTRLLMSGCEVHLGMKWEDFLAQTRSLIEENYEYSFAMGEKRRQEAQEMQDRMVERLLGGHL